MEQNRHTIIYKEEGEMGILIFQNHYEYLSRINFVLVTQFPYKRSLKLSREGGGGVSRGVGVHTRGPRKLAEAQNS